MFGSSTRPRGAASRPSAGPEPSRSPSRRAAWLLLAAGLVWAQAGSAPSALAGPKPLGLRHVAIDLPGPPAEILHADLDGDGRQDLAIVIARTQWGEIGTDRIEGMMQISEVVPALFDRREVRAYRLGDDGAYVQVGDALSLPPSVLSLEAGPPGIPIAVLTDDGLSALRLVMDGAEARGAGGNGTTTAGGAPGITAAGEGARGGRGRADPGVDGEIELPAVPGMGAGAAAAPAHEEPAARDDAATGPARDEGRATGPALVLVPVIADRPALAGSKTLVPRLGMVRDLDGDGTVDLLFPARDGIAIYMTEKGALATRPASRLVLPGDRRHTGTAPARSYPAPEIGDLDGDHRPDLFQRNAVKGSTVIEVLHGEGGGRFGPPKRITLDGLQEAAASAAKASSQRKGSDGGEADHDSGLAYFGDLDGDGLAEAVYASRVDTGKGGLKQAKEPEFLYRFHHVGKDLTVQAQPYQELLVKGFGFSMNAGDVSSEEFTDLDGDGRKDLVTVTLDFSLFQIVRVMTTKRIGVGLDFHVWHQGDDGRFEPVTGLDLSETLRMDLNNLKLTSLAQFAGDFDGDGRADFVHLGRGKQVTIHRGQPGCRYAAKADLTVPLVDEPEDVSLVRIGDFDGDGRADIAVIRPLDETESDVSAPVRLDLYLSGGAR